MKKKIIAVLAATTLVFSCVVFTGCTSEEEQQAQAEAFKGSFVTAMDTCLDKCKEEQAAKEEADRIAAEKKKAEEEAAAAAAAAKQSSGSSGGSSGGCIGNSDDLLY